MTSGSLHFVIVNLIDANCTVEYKDTKAFECVVVEFVFR